MIKLTNKKRELLQASLDLSISTVSNQMQGMRGVDRKIFEESLKILLELVNDFEHKEPEGNIEIDNNKSV
jgi:hypothetical protein